ncbi:MAG: hypothetical protein HOF74_07540 [Gammaproteobacteria bacterium]|nr:hypothetical protein [Gammaproteobacteria bacterium]MBT3859665.1 hypothetical protein [Gammaproteobacteria bacterium]MBT3987638.1 hypothetical protein [Gammaproteobacteria bacterium]MBT4581622.1 hypothetical protein [Gammaproteobacteria bacterium]MBT4659408.1 hypothetical protein [Gammaproteobacteria bacterium]
MHDIMDLESRGLPSGFVASREFVDAAEAQGKSLGIKPASVFVAHPIQDRTDEEMAQLARESIEAITGLICE